MMNNNKDSSSFDGSRIASCEASPFSKEVYFRYLGTHVL